LEAIAGMDQVRFIQPKQEAMFNQAEPPNAPSDILSQDQ